MKEGHTAKHEGGKKASEKVSEHLVKRVSNSLGSELKQGSHSKTKSYGKVSGFHYVVFGLLGIVLLFNLFQLGDMSGAVEEAVEKAKMAAVPAKVELVVITDKVCDQCFDISSTVDAVKGAHVNVTSEKNLDVLAPAAKKLIEQYGIEKIPTVIISGEIEKSGIRNAEEIDGALVFTQVAAPFTDAVSGKIRGLVSVTQVVDSSCASCFDLASTVAELEERVTIASNKKVEFASALGKSLLSRYSITQVPTMILSKDLDVYEEVASIFKDIGSVEKDGSYVLRDIAPPYINASTGTLIGLVALTMITDTSCGKCYDVSIHKNIMGRFGLVFGEESTVDISSAKGKDLVAKYSLKEVPTVILSRESEAYPALTSVWDQVGDIAADGSFIFRNNEVIGVTFKDLESNKIIEPEEAPEGG